MKGHLELFEHRLKQVGEKLPGMEGKDIDAVFDALSKRWAPTRCRSTMCTAAPHWQIITILSSSAL